MMVRKNFKTMPAALLILISIVLSGCSKAPEPDVAKTGNVNQVTAASNNNPVPANNVSANAPEVSTTISGNNNTVAPNSNKDKKTSPVVKAPTPQIGSGGGDMFLLAQARSALSSDNELLNHVIVEIKDGSVTLTGNVSSPALKAKAGQLVQGVQGIKSVKNNLRVS